MVNLSIPVINIKPGQVVDYSYECVTLDPPVGFKVDKGDTGVLVYVYAAESCTVTVRGGEGPMACGNLRVHLDEGCEKLLWLETGRYADHDGVIVLESTGADTEAHVIQLN